MFKSSAFILLDYLRFLSFIDYILIWIILYACVF